MKPHNPSHHHSLTEAQVPPEAPTEVRVPAYLATIAPGDYAQALLHPDSLLHMDIPRERTIHEDDPLDGEA